LTAPQPRPPWRPAEALFPDMGLLTEAVLLHGVPGAPPLPAGAASWAEEADILIGQGLAGLALDAATASALTIPDEVDERLRRVHLMQVGTTLAVEARGSALVAELASTGIPAVITKGPGVARMYPALAQRSFSDLDVLVRPGDFHRAIELLHERGLRPGPRQRGRRYFDRYCYEALNLGGPGRASIDVHHHIPPWQWGRRLLFDDLHRWSRPAQLGGGEVRLAHPAHNLLVCALHVIADRDGAGRTLRTWRDVVTLSGGTEPDVVAAEARRVGLDWWLRFVLAELPLYARPSSLMASLGPVAPSPSDRARLRALLPPGLGSRHHVGQMFRLPAANAAAFAMGEAFPSRDVIRAKLGAGTTVLSWWGASARRFRGRERSWPVPDRADSPRG
jgi:hypothetical protein